jgi:hypothetical protein
MRIAAMKASFGFVALFVLGLLSLGSAVNITSFSSSLRWRFTMGSYVKAMPKLSADGRTVYSSSGEGCASTANTMFALSVDTGSVQWQVNDAPCCTVHSSVITPAGAAGWQQQLLHSVSLLLRP